MQTTAAGSQLRMYDDSGTPRWSTVVDAAFLDAARARGQHWKTKAEASTKTLLASTSNAVLSKQIAFERGRSTDDNRDVEPAPRGHIARAKTRAAANRASTGPRPASVTDGNSPASYAEVRAYDDANRFAGSAHTNADGNFALDLRAGNYRFEADAYRTPEVFDNEPWLYRAPGVVTAPAGPGLALPQIALPEARSEIMLRLTLPCAVNTVNAGPPYRLLVNLATAQGKQIQHALFPTAAAVTQPSNDNTCLVPYALRVSPGTYSLAITPLGWPRRMLGAVDATNNVAVAETFVAADRSLMWNGTLRDAAGQPQKLTRVTVFDEAYRRLASVVSLPDGTFSLPWQPGWSAEVQASPTADDATIWRSFTFGDTVPSPDVRLDGIELFAQPEGDAVRMYGDGDRTRRYNIVFVAEGYTGAHETFTDRNANGVWDGVVWNDVNHNGTYDSGDAIQTYGTAKTPVPGSNPTVQNEPFTDLNNDGALSIDDAALFRANIRDYLRLLFGSDVWREQRDVFNAHAVFDASPQAGYDILAEDESRLLERQTLYGAYIDPESEALLLDRASAFERAAAAVPEVDLVVALVNQPIIAGRANATFGEGGVIVFNGGHTETLPNYHVESHEMGHAFAGLCDEYVEERGQHSEDGATLDACPNTTLSLQPADIPWHTLLPPDQTIPTLDTDGSVGVYIGSDYFSDGAYRPSINSMMSNQGTNPFFNAPSRAAIEQAACLIRGGASCGSASTALDTATWWNPAEPGWGVFTADQGSALALGWFTYDDDGEPIWFLSNMGPASADGGRSGDVLRVTGNPFDEGAAADAPQTIGTAALRFSADHQSLEFTTSFGAVTTTKQLQRFHFGDQDIVCRANPPASGEPVNYSDLWWSPGASGWGVHMSHVGDTVFATWYTYDASREAIFLIGAASLQPDGSYAGALLRQRDGTPFSQIDGRPASSGADQVGTLSLRFGGSDNAQFDYIIGSTAQSKPLTRLQFGDTRNHCETLDVPASNRGSSRSPK